jgi:hypothetical protein
MTEEVNPLPANDEPNLPILTDKKIGATSAYVGLNEGVRLSGVSKPTFLKYVEKGRFSPIINEQGRKVYQVVDIQRVFPTGAKATSQSEGQTDPSLHKEKGGLTAVQIALLKAENERLKEKLEAEQDKARLLVQIADDAKQNAEDWKLQAERATLMLTHRPEITAAPEAKPAATAPKKRWRLFGGGDR